MIDLKTEMYEWYLLETGFYQNNNVQFNSEGTCFTLSPEKGKGDYWFYAFKNIFSITILDFVLYEDLILEYPQQKYLNICYYESASGEDIAPSKQLNCPCLKCYIGEDNLYQGIYRKNIPIRCTGIVITPEYIEEYLRTKCHWNYEIFKEAFAKLDGATDFPELIFLLKQIKSCRLTGPSAKLYYESKVMEAISIIVQRTKEIPHKSIDKRLALQDLESLSYVVDFIENNLADEINLCSLSKIACMGTTKLKYTFKEVYKSTISDYILNKRIIKAKQLLICTDLSINQISRIVGYKKAGSFSEIFRKTTGLLPKEYRKLCASK